MLALSCLAALAACGSDSGDATVDKPPDYARPRWPAPRSRWRRSTRRPNRAPPGGTDAFQRQHRRRCAGHPVVVNKWASWCGPCREEFPWLQQAPPKLRQAGRLPRRRLPGPDDAAKTFLDEFPLPYPSYTDPDQEIGKACCEAGRRPSRHQLLRPSGKLVYTQQGAYASQADLTADIRRYALGTESPPAESR